MESEFPELNLTQLCGIASAWARRHPSINRVALYRHTGGGPNDRGKRYLVDICMDDDAPLNQIEQIQIKCSTIDSAEFFQDLREASLDKFESGNWELYERQVKDSTPNLWIADNHQGIALFERSDNPDFPEINISFLKETAKRWVGKYPDVQFDQILLYRYASDSGPSIPVKYAVVFEIQHYERVYEDLYDDDYQLTEFKRMKGANDPYERFIWHTNFRSTIVHPVDDKDKPEVLYPDFSRAYKNIAPERWYFEWVFIPQYKGISLPLQVRVDEGQVVLYQHQNARQHEKQDPVARQVAIQVPDGTTWFQIHLRYVDDERIEIDRPGSKMAPYKPENLGLKESLIDDLCEFADESKELVYLNKNRKYRLNKQLKAIFPGIVGNPIESKKKGYLAHFHIRKA